MKLTYVLRENVLTDNILEVPEKGYIFKGGIVAVLKEYSFQNEWNDKLTIKKFKKQNSLLEYLNKNYQNLDLDFTGTILNN